MNWKSAVKSKMNLKKTRTGNYMHAGSFRLTLLSCLVFGTVVSAVAEESTGHPDLQGVWKTSYVSLDDPRWSIVDLACSGFCSLAAYQHLDALLNDPANKDRSVKELLAESQTFGEQELAKILTPLARQKQAEFDVTKDPAVDCDPDGDGLRHQVTAPLPIRIDQYDDKLVFNYEYWKAVRTVFIDGRGHPEDGKASRLGHSIGRFEGDTLVVETAQILPALISLPGGYIRHSPDALLIERYTRTGDRLDLVWKIADPVHFSEPYVGQKASLHAPDWELDEFVCEAITGEF
jgi:hypothetical protein